MWDADPPRPPSSSAPAPASPQTAPAPTGAPPGCSAPLAMEPALLPPPRWAAWVVWQHPKKKPGGLFGVHQRQVASPPSPRGGAHGLPSPLPRRSRHRRSATDLFLKKRRLTPGQGLQERGGSRGWHRHHRPRWEPWPQRGAPPGLPRDPPPGARSGGVAPSSSSRLRPWRRGWSTWPPWPGWCRGRGEPALWGKERGGRRGSGVRGMAGSPQPPPSTLGQLALTRVPLLPPHHGDRGAARWGRAGLRG